MPNSNQESSSIFSRKIVSQALAVSLLAAAPAVHAFAPMDTEDAGTQGKFNSEIELGYFFDHATSQDGEDPDGRVDVKEHTNSVPATYTFGITDTVDASLGLSRQLSSDRGWNNTELGLKWNFWGNPDSGWSAAVKPTLSIPVSKRAQTAGLGTGRTNWGLTLIGSYAADDYEFHTNVRYNSNYLADLPAADSERAHLWEASVAPVWNINDQWKMGVEFGVRTNPGYDGRTQGFTQLAMAYSPTDNLEIGVGVGMQRVFGSENKHRGYTIATTIAYRF